MYLVLTTPDMANPIMSVESCAMRDGTVDRPNGGATARLRRLTRPVRSRRAPHLRDVPHVLHEEVELALADLEHAHAERRLQILLVRDQHGCDRPAVPQCTQSVSPPLATRPASYHGDIPGLSGARRAGNITGSYRARENKQLGK